MSTPDKSLPEEYSAVQRNSTIQEPSPITLDMGVRPNDQSTQNQLSTDIVPSHSVDIQSQTVIQNSLPEALPIIPALSQIGYPNEYPFHITPSEMVQSHNTASVRQPPQSRADQIRDLPTLNQNLVSLEPIRVFISSFRSSTTLNSTTERGGPPPSYEEALDPNAPPPPYESLFGQVQEARRTSDGPLDFAKNLTILLLGTIGCLACIGLWVVVPGTMIAIGSLYYHECPVDPNIPLYLVVAGTLAFMKHLLSRYSLRRNQENNQLQLEARPSKLNSFLSTFSFIWFILALVSHTDCKKWIGWGIKHYFLVLIPKKNLRVIAVLNYLSFQELHGSIWVYKVYEPSYDPMSINYCHPTLYLFTFWLFTSIYIVMGLVVICICCCSCAAAFLIAEE